VLEVPVGFYLEAGWDTDGEGRFWGREVGGVGGALGGEEGFEEGGESTAAQLGGGHFRCVFLSSEEFESWEGRW
jgi:hypothetical protein